MLIDVYKTLFSVYGVKGEVVELPKMFARQLLAQKEAIYASPENIEEFALDPVIKKKLILV